MIFNSLEVLGDLKIYYLGSYMYLKKFKNLEKLENLGYNYKNKQGKVFCEVPRDKGELHESHGLTVHT